MLKYKAPEAYELPFAFSHGTVQVLLAKLEQGKIPGGKIEEEHAIASPRIREMAFWYLQSFKGSNSFLLSVKDQMNKYGELSPKQLAAVATTILREAKNRKESEEQNSPVKASQLPATPSEPASPPPVQPEPTKAPEGPVSPSVVDGIYTIVLNEQGDYKTIRIEEASEASRLKFKLPEGAQIASFLSGSDNDSDYTGFAFVRGGNGQIWSRFKADSSLAQALFILLKADKETAADYGQAYALKSNRCWRCNRTLTVPASIGRGLGPICAEKLGF